MPERPPATPPARLFRVVIKASFHARPLAASPDIVDASSSQYESASSHPKLNNRSAAITLAALGAREPSIMPTCDDSRAPTALQHATITLTRVCSGDDIIPSETPTAKLSNDDVVDSTTICRTIRESMDA